MNSNPVGLLSRYQAKHLTHAVESSRANGTVSDELKWGKQEEVFGPLLGIHGSMLGIGMPDTI